jgi:MFS family permease
MGIPLNFYAILLMQILLSVNAAFFDPAIPSIIPQIVSDKDLTAANSRYQFVASFSMIAGAFWGGILISSIGYAWVFVANAASFLISAFFECFIQIPVLPKPFPGHPPPSIWTTLGQGYRYIFSARPLLLLLFVVMAIHFFVGSVEVFMPVIANDISRDGARVLGFFQAVLGVGSLAMAMLSGFLPISGNERSWLFGSVFCMGGLFCTGFFFRGNEFELTGLFLWMMGGAGGCIISASIAFKTLLQKIVDNAYAGRVFAVAGSVGNASIPGAMLFYGGLLDKVAFQPLLLGTGLILMLLTSVLFMLYREKHHDREQKITT